MAVRRCGAREGAGVLQPDAIPVWLNKPVRALDHDRPVELIARGGYWRVAELLAELETPTF